MANKTNKSERWRWWRIDAAGLFVCAALTVFVYATSLHPILVRQVDAVQQAIELDNNKSESENVLSSLTELKRSLANIEQKLAESPLRLHPVTAVNQRIAAITGFADKSGLQINKIQPAAPIAGTHYDTVPIHLAGLGNYQKVAAFLHQLHSAFPDMGVIAFDLTGKPADPKQPAEFRFQLAWFAAPIERITQ
jgi:Tfp pilus assembly protein PilO